jgi:chromosome segregation ATPase
MKEITEKQAKKIICTHGKEEVGGIKDDFWMIVDVAIYRMGYNDAVKKHNAKRKMRKESVDGWLNIELQKSRLEFQKALSDLCTSSSCPKPDSDLKQRIDSLSNYVDQVVQRLADSCSRIAELKKRVDIHRDQIKKINSRLV